jgi:4-hydroxy-tetrahydrodipicolinate reductase
MDGPPRTRVAVVGAEGRMGCFACALLDESARFEVAGRVTRDDDLDAVLAECGAEVGLDLTRAGLGFAHGVAMLGRGVRPVIGTSGVATDEVAELDRLARASALGGIVVPNFSLGMCLLQSMAERAAAWFGDVEVLELHHDGKVDAPSATARDTARRIARGLRGPRAAAADADPSRGLDVDGVPVHAVRLPGLVAHQEVLFGATGELLTLRHDVTSHEAYGPGILIALAHAARADGVRWGLEAALDHASRA